MHLEIFSLPAAELGQADPGQHSRACPGGVGNSEPMRA